MRVKKTRQSAREMYRYPVEVEDGRGGYRTVYNVIKPGEDGVTEVEIKSLHSMDDAEVYNNLKNIRPQMTEEEKAAKKQWEKEHPGEKYEVLWNASLDYLMADDAPADESRFLASASYEPFADEEVSDDVQRLRDIVASMSERQKQVYRLVLIEEYSLTDAAKIMGCSPANVKQICNRVVSLIRTGFKK
jgi:RNA polymerase sigma factor (sigma-70 family)